MSKRGRIRQTWISLLLVLVMTVQLLPASVIAVEIDAATVTSDAAATATDADSAITDAVTTPTDAATVTTDTAITATDADSEPTDAATVTTDAAATAIDADSVTTGTAAMMIAAPTVAAVAETGAATVASGSCGPATDGVNADNATWVLTSDGTLTISGSGQMDWSSAWSIDATPIKSVVVEEGITEIISEYGWWNMETLSLPASLTYFNAELINNCNAIESITLAEGSESYKLVDGALLSIDGTVLHWYPTNHPGDTYNVPDGVKTIGDYAVYGNENLNTVTLPDGLVTIGKSAFTTCQNLRCEIVIPKTVKTLGDDCFFCTCFARIVIPDDSVLETIGEAAIGDNYTDELTLPATLRSVGARSMPFGMKEGALLTFYSKTVTFGKNAIYEGSTVYGYAGSTVEAYANAINSNESEWDDINFIPLEADAPDLSGQGKTIGFLPGVLDEPVPNYADAFTTENYRNEEFMGFTGERSGISLISGSVTEEKDAVLKKLTFTMQLQATLTDSEQAIPAPIFALSSAKEAATTLTVDEITTEEELASGARWYTVTMENGSFSDGEIVLTCAYDAGLQGWYSTYLKEVKAVYAYADGSDTGAEATPARVAANSYFVIKSFNVGDGTTVKLVAGGLNTETGAASLFDGGWKRGDLPATVDGKTAIYQTAGQSATVSLKLTAGSAQEHYSKTTVKCYLSDSADGYASGQLLKELSFTDGDDYATMEALVKAHPIELTLPRQAAGSVKYLTAEVTTLYALFGKSGTVTKTHTVAIVTKATNAELYSASADGVLNGYGGSESTMTLPATVGSTTVKTVGALADGNQYGTREVVVSSGIRNLADNALKDFRELATVRLPESIKTVGSKALATGSDALTVRIDSADPQSPTFAEDAVDLSTTSLTVQCYSGSAAEAWANALKETEPDRVTVITLDDSRMLRIEIKNAEGQVLGQDSFTSVEWLREGSDTVLGRGVSYTLSENAAIGAEQRYVCRVTFSPAIRFNYTVPVTMRYTFDSIGTQSYQLPLRDKNITVKGSFTAEQIDNGFEAYLTVQEPDGDIRYDLTSVTQSAPSFSVSLSGRFPTTLYAVNASGGELTMSDVQSRPTDADGAIDLGELTLPNRNIQQTIESEIVSTSGNYRKLDTLVNSYGGFVLLDKNGNEFTDFTLSVKRNDLGDYCWLVLKLGDSVRDLYFVGDTLTLRQVTTQERSYWMPDATITLRLATQTAERFALSIERAGTMGFSDTSGSDYYVFDADGNLVCDHPRYSVYLKPATYTVIGIRKNAFISSISSPTEPEELGIPAENYLKETVTLEAEQYYAVGNTPDFLRNTITLTATADEQMMSNGLVPVYIQYYNQLFEQSGQDREWTIRIAAKSDAYHDATLPLERLEGKYAYSTEGEIVSESVSHTDGLYSYEQLELTVRGASGSICLYAKATGRTLTVKVDGTGVATNLALPRESISMPAPDRSTSQTEGTLHLYAQLFQSSGTSYVGRVYVDNKLQTEKRLAVNGTGENLLSYQLKRYSDGSASHTVRAEVWQKANGDEERIWTSDEYTVLLLPVGESTAEPVKLSMRMFMSREDSHGNLQLVKDFDLQSGSYGRVIYTLYPNDFNADNTLKNDMVLDYQLTLTNPELVRNGRVVLRVYSGSESDPTLTDLILRLNSATNTFDGTLTLEGGSYGINDMPYGYDLRYYDDAEISISMDQLAEEITQREEEMRSDVPEDSMMPTEPVDMEELEYFLLQLPEDEFTEEEKQALRDFCIAHNEWCARLEEIRASTVAELEELTGCEFSEDMTMEELFALIGEFTEGLMPEMLEEGDELLDREYLLSHGYRQAGDTAVYVYEDQTSDYISVVDLDGRIQMSAGELPQQSRMMRSVARGVSMSDIMDKMAVVNQIIQSITAMTNLAIDAACETLARVSWSGRAVGLEKFLYEKVGTVENLDLILETNIKIAKSNNKLDGAGKLRQSLTNFATAMSNKNLEGMNAALARINSNKAIQKIPVSNIVTVVGLVFDVYGVFCSYSETMREVNNCYKEISTANYYLARLRAAANSSDECREALAAYLPECIDAVEELQTDAHDILDAYIGRLFCRVQSAGVDTAIAALGFGGLATKKAQVVAGVSVFAFNNVSELAINISLVKNMHELEDDWVDVQKSCIDPLLSSNCDESGGGGGGDSGSGGGSSGDDGDDDWFGGDDWFDDDDGDWFGGDDDSSGEPQIPAPTDSVIDPAGYVYEAVESNRVEGAEATIWYRDESGNATAWEEAPEYGEVMTQTTGTDGGFSWMTPQGKWLVTVSKAGYADADSSADPAAQDGWLPVPPPQLNVNIALVSESAPEVVSAQAAGDVIRVVFSQYMDVAQFANGALLTVTQNGEPVAVTVSFADSEVSPTDADAYYGRVLELRRTDGERFADGVSLTVDRTAKNYAGTAMTETYGSGSMSVQPIVGSIVHSYPNRFVTEVGEAGTLAVQVLDTTGKPLAGVTVTAVQQTGGTLELAATAVSDSNGRAVFAVKGITSGYDVITFSADIVRGTMNTRVAPLSTTAPKKPTANLTDYEVVSVGTQLVITAQQGATIRYTTNNTCPCTEEALTYTAPITLEEAGEYFFRIAAWTQAGGYSERLNLHITVQSDGSGDGSGDSSGDSSGDDSSSGDSGSTTKPSGTKPSSTKPATQPAQKVQFADVPESAYYYDAVAWAVANGITTGTSETTFSPDMTCTRAQIVTFLYRAAVAQGADVSVGEDTNILSYTDALEIPEYAFAAFQWACGAGIVQGADGKLMPNGDCTRMQIVTMLYRYAVATGKAVRVGEDSNILSYTDALEIPEYAFEPFQWACGAGIVQGADGKLMPSVSCTRAQIVTMLYRSTMAK